MIAISASCRNKDQVTASEIAVATIITAVLTQKSYFVLARKNNASGRNSNASLTTSLVDEEYPLSTAFPSVDHSPAMARAKSRASKG